MSNVTVDKIGIEAPWYTYQKKLNALFERDPDIAVDEICESDDDRTDYILDIEVFNHEKFIALDRVLPKVLDFGNVTLGVYLYDEENGVEPEDDIALYETIFKGNPIVKDILTVDDRCGVRHGFVRFKPEVIQFFHDDISDYNGNWSGLAQDIAKEIFEDDLRGVHFCTAGVNEKDDEVGKPLGEWP